MALLIHGSMTGKNGHFGGRFLLRVWIAWPRQRLVAESSYREFEKTENSPRLLARREDTSTTPYVGFGVGYDFSERFGMSLNYNYVRADALLGDVTAQTLTVGGEVRF